MLSPLQRKAFGGLLQLLIGVTALLFVASWTLDYWQAWLFLFVFFAPILAITLYLMRMDPKLLERRTNRTEKRSSQRLIQSFATVAFVVIIVLPAIDHRRRWSRMPAKVVLAGDGLVAIGLLVIFFVFRENTFTSATIEIHPQQKVISTGPYAVVRHPMYAGALIMLVGMPLALGSWWGLLTIIPITLVIILRLLDEEAFLEASLPGYSEYRKKVKHRLLPFIW